ncbi:hypothetical protein [Clostridium saccharobutylicum]|uniref:Peptidase C39-like domain-containing protein n=1 Tax=Clostridium saccharobutylicum DSM 13864 TaxID=1345695 RepID=U5MS46_CLOSA|nr:hypothetical protein [Clostridium saccharobutylicum]AGX43353.1 hypothetical protein CLSA_c23790 [Clostridium saccharobutylicum DSM 13864]AQR90652.1 hypothetical protein CLOSC_23730 [Clostridium saccharobutylicum]AQS00556.1 hypothetical protein CSACC_23800 [Clostridium saccharobutylicum]AQS10208.1 hypothetical protein CLOBY_23510 [Clostridium saccharobutylicum]AQS14539.1 hypothetical protein CLOSACC_23800 [Clostridium saccharobutylicum]
MKKIKMKVIPLGISLALSVGTIFTPVSAFAGTEDQLDGQVTVFHQGEEGDCGAVSAIQAFDNSTYGKGFIMRLIKQNSDGSYTLNFGTGKVTVSRYDAINARITGDFDAKVIEAALQNEMNVYNGCFASDVFTKMTGFDQKQIRGNKAKTNLMNTMAKNCYSGQGITAACDFKYADESKGIIGDGGHSYSIRCVLNDTVVLINPWDTSKYIYMPRSQFENSIRYMTYVDNNSKKVTVFWS